MLIGKQSRNDASGIVECPVCEHRWWPDKVRSLPQHKRFHALIAAAFASWPETHERQFPTVKALRKWATAKAGYYDVTGRIHLSGVRESTAVLLAQAAMGAAGAHAIATAHKGELVIIVAKSIRFDRMGQDQFNELCNRVADVLAAEIGCEADAILNGADA